jgi:porphobilinogen synthase
MQFGPLDRPRRLRRGSRLRDLVHETDLGLEHLIQGVFVGEGTGVEEPISSLPGIARRSIDRLVEHARHLRESGVRHLLLFGIPATKDALGSDADADEGIIQRALLALRAADLDMTLVADTCLCEYTDHGHCGILSDDHAQTVDNDATLERLASLAVAQAEAGADVIAPSGMMDGTVAVVREALDRHGFEHIPIMMYSVKYASAFYGPFREAAQGAPSFGDRRGYQMDPRNGREALVEAALDEAEGADILMVKPALAYLDILRRLRERTDRPLAAYNVSGEYAMVKAAAERGWIDEQAVVVETLTAMRRAGADIILTYHAEAFAEWQRLR